MSTDTLETVLRWGSERQIVRTERRARTLAAFEAAHTKAVREALVAHRVRSIEIRYAEEKVAAERRDWNPRRYEFVKDGGASAKAAYLAWLDEQHEKELRAARRFPANGGHYVDCRKGHPRPRRDKALPDYLKQYQEA